MRRLQNRTGFALPLGVVFLVVLSFALAAGLSATAAEGSTSTAQRGQNRAYTIAEQGLQRFLVSRDTLCRQTGLSGLDKQGLAGQIDGNDQCGKKPPIAGIMVPKGDYTTSGGFVPTGSPPLDTTKTLAQLDSLVTIDWHAIVNNNLLPADYTL